MRRDRRVEWLRRRTTAFLLFLRRGGDFWLEDCAAAGEAKGGKPAHRIATIKKILIRTDSQR
jgi:hypothetical protein